MDNIDPYYCIVCGHQGEHQGIIGMDTPCDKCGSLLIVPLSSVYIMNMDEFQDLADMFQGMDEPKKRHLSLVPPVEEGDTNEKKGK